MLLRSIFRFARFAARRLPWLGARFALLSITYTRIPVPMDGAEEALATRALALMADGLTQTQTSSGRTVMTYRLNPGGPRGKALLLHGWTGQAAFMMGYGQVLMAAGYEVVALDYPGHGKSPGRITNLREMGEACADLMVAAGPFDIVITHSVGGPVLAAAMRNSRPAQQVKGAKMVTVSAPYALKDVTDATLDWLDASQATRDAFEALIGRVLHMPLVDVQFDKMLGDYADQFTCVHCQDDTYIPYGLNTQKFQGSGVPVVSLNGVGHRAILYDSKAIEQITNLVH